MKRALSQMQLAEESVGRKPHRPCSAARQPAPVTPPRCAPQVASSAVARRAREILQQRSEPPQEVVCYGVGDIVGSNTARLQLALALCLAQALGIERGARSSRVRSALASG